MISNFFKSLAVLALIIIVTFTQDPSTPSPELVVTQVPHTVQEIKPDVQPQTINPQIPKENNNIEQADSPPVLEKVQINAENIQSHQRPKQPELSGQTIEPQVFKGSPQEDHAQNINKLDPAVSQTKNKIKQLISEMSDEDLAGFEDQLAGDARKYYDEIMHQEMQLAEKGHQEYQDQYQEIEDEQTITSIKSNKETQQFDKEWDRFADRDITYNQYLFQIEKAATQDFRISIPVAQHVTFYGYTYENIDGVYSVPENVEEQDPIWVYVYENNHKILFQKDFYFKYFADFQGQENSSYLIRFVNPSHNKMIAFNLAVLFQIGHSAQKLTAVDVADHSRRIKISHDQVEKRLQDSTSRNVMQSQNRGNLMDKLQRYYIYSIVEIFIIALIAVFQVESVRKILSPRSIV